jgi:murein L,D-transpeptidase YcbB/YkuD
VGLEKYKYHYNELAGNVEKNFVSEDSVDAMKMDKLFSDAAIAYCKDVFEGIEIDKWVSYDEVSRKNEAADDNYLIRNLVAARSSNELIYFLTSLEPAENEYAALKNELQNNLKLTSLQRLQLATSLNFYRWIHHFNFEKCVVVNIASATLRYYEYDSLKLMMRVIVGKPSTRTPRFAAHCNQVILYPYWNVPTSIAVNELLPQFKRNPVDIDILNMQLIDANGNVIDHHKLNWAIYNRKYFPFRIRQSTGCDNSLGVIKFNLTSPLGVYLHDTDNKGAFLSNYSYRSHGCIRVQEPIKLANYLAPNLIDSKFLESCLKDQVPFPINLVTPVPVFVVFQTAEVDTKNVVKYYKDVYGILR